MNFIYRINCTELPCMDAMQDSANIESHRAHEAALILRGMIFVHYVTTYLHGVEPLRRTPYHTFFHAELNAPINDVKEQLKSEHEEHQG